MKPRWNASRLMLVLLVTSAASQSQMPTQAAKAVSTPPAITVSLTLAKSPVPVGQQDYLTLSLKNISQQEIPLQTDYRDYRIHISNGQTEAPKTAYHRQILGEGLPGEEPLMGGGVTLSILPGAVGIRRYDIFKFFNLSVPGVYTVYMDVQDEISGQWLKTNTVQFEVQAPATH